MNANTTVFTLTVRDIQQVAKDVFGKELTQKEMEFVEEHLDEHIPWYEGTAKCIKDGIS